MKLKSRFLYSWHPKKFTLWESQYIFFPWKYSGRLLWFDCVPQSSCVKNIISNAIVQHLRSWLGHRGSALTWINAVIREVAPSWRMSLAPSISPVGSLGMWCLPTYYDREWKPSLDMVLQSWASQFWKLWNNKFLFFIHHPVSSILWQQHETGLDIFFCCTLVLWKLVFSK